MRHYKKGRKLGTDASHTKAIKKSLVVNLFANDRIKTTLERAKEIRGDVDRVVTWAKRGDVHSRRLAIAALGDQHLVGEIFAKVEQGLFEGRDGGYTRIMRLGKRRGDGATVVIMELCQEPVVKKEKYEEQEETPRRGLLRGRRSRSEAAETEAEAEEAAEAAEDLDEDLDEDNVLKDEADEDLEDIEVEDADDDEVDADDDGADDGDADEDADDADDEDDDESDDESDDADEDDDDDEDDADDDDEEADDDVDESDDDESDDDDEDAAADDSDEADSDDAEEAVDAEEAADGDDEAASEDDDE